MRHHVTVRTVTLAVEEQVESLAGRYDPRTQS